VNAQSFSQTDITPTMSTLFHVLVLVYRLVVASWNTCIVFLQVVRSVMQEAKQEAAELVALLDDGASMMVSRIDGPVTIKNVLLIGFCSQDPVTSTSTSLLLDTRGPENPWQMLIVARASSFVLLLRLSKYRVLHLEVDEVRIRSAVRSNIAQLAAIMIVLDHRDLLPVSWR
jgi:hypothetical protein